MYGFDLERIAQQRVFLNTVDEIMDTIRNNNRFFKPLAFLDTVEFAGNKKDDWIEKALADYESIPELKNCGEFKPAVKCLLVKGYRKILQRKRKSGEKNPIVSEGDMLEYVKNL